LDPEMVCIVVQLLVGVATRRRCFFSRMIHLANMTHVTRGAPHELANSARKIPAAVLFGANSKRVSFRKIRGFHRKKRKPFDKMR
jgi:hypothetical protein